MTPLAPDRFRLGATDVEAVFVPTQDGNARLEAIGSAREIESTLGRRVYAWRAPAHPTAEQLDPALRLGEIRCEIAYDRACRSDQTRRFQVVS